MHGAALRAMVAAPLDELLPIATELQRAGRDVQAESLADHILAARPDQPDALHIKALAAYRAGQPQRAVDLIERAFHHGLDASLYWRTVCTLHERLNRLEDAVAAGHRAVALDPTNAQAYHNLTLALYRRLDLDGAVACARRALELDPTLPAAHFALAEALLLRGEFAEGWREYEWRFQIPGAASPMPSSDRPQWDGSPMADKTLLLVADQGFGDIIQFARYIPWAARRCPHLAIACGEEVRSLLSPLHPEARLFSRWSECPGFAAFSFLSGLPRLHQMTLATIPAAEPYLRADPMLTAIWRERLRRLLPSGYRAIGIAWAGRPSHNNDINRSATLRDFAAIAACRRVALVSLQKGEARVQIGGYQGRAPLLNLGPELTSFEVTAAVIESLDLVVSVDTSVVHLAGAMGRPVWVLLPFAPDWRWLLDRSDSPWYPTARLFRQSVARCWSDVTEAVATAIQGLGVQTYAVPVAHSRSHKTQGRSWSAPHPHHLSVS